MQKGTIFVQPHSDDIAMSSYFLIKAEILSKPYFLLTVFGQSNWLDPIKSKGEYAENNNMAEITRSRKTEDERFAKSLDLKLLFFNLEDCLLRNGKVFYNPKKELDQNLLGMVGKTLSSSLRKYKAKNIVAPFPSGKRQHYDHRIVCEAIKSLSGNLYSRFFLDDIPYSRVANFSKHNLSMFARQKGNMNDKFKAMSIYDSQMCRLFFDQTRKIFKQNQGYERLFLFTKV